jgi:hypothetical protein
MSGLTARIRNDRAAGLARSARPNLSAEDAQPSPDNTSRRLLWSAGAVAFVLGIVAFLLWGVNGAGTLFDMIAALCN